MRERNGASASGAGGLPTRRSALGSGGAPRLKEMKNRWALVVMGAWLMGTLCTSIVATENFYTIDRLLADRANLAFASAVDRLGSPQARDLLRYLASELNRLYFQIWNVTQIVLGALAFWLIAERRARRGVMLMVAIVLLMLVYLTPAIVSLGRSLDFVPRDPAPPRMQRFWILHAVYTTLEMIKLLIGGVVTVVVARQTLRGRDDLRAFEGTVEVHRFEP